MNQSIGVYIVFGRDEFSSRSDVTVYNMLAQSLAEQLPVGVVGLLLPWEYFVGDCLKFMTYIFSCHLYFTGFGFVCVGCCGSAAVFLRLSESHWYTDAKFSNSFQVSRELLICNCCMRLLLRGQGSLDEDLRELFSMFLSHQFWPPTASVYLLISACIFVPSVFALVSSLLIFFSALLLRLLLPQSFLGAELPFFPHP